MAKPYSDDLRARVVNDIAEGATLAETADHHHVSLSSVVRFLRLKRNTATSAPRSLVDASPTVWRRMQNCTGAWWRNTEIRA